MPRTAHRTRRTELRDLVQVAGGSFVMGSELGYPEETPAHPRTVEAFSIDRHPVTNAEFRHFVADTGYVTTAENPPSARDFPDANASELVPGSLVFTGCAAPVPLDDWTRWWSWVPGAQWRHPLGPGSTLGGLERHPVVHVTFEDATAYADWAGKELPTESEWEYAARAGGATTYAWGDEFTVRNRRMANTWDGQFPWQNLDRRHSRTSPVGTYPANAWDLVDMIGNVWEWTASPWTESHGPADLPTPAAPSCCGGAAPVGETDRRTTKGGSHLCAESYCRRYRPAARQGQSVRSSTSHIGFRCVVR
jgi:formylglycine-generating enzyme required for sulfatase activity